MAKRLGFYRPHKPVRFDNLSLDPVTGELAPLPSMTKQEFRDECDINNVIKSFSQSGMFKHVSARAAEGQYLDLPDQVDYQESLDRIRDAQATFMTLPSALRRRFGDDPAEFLAFVHDPQNTEELRTLGLANPLPTPTPPVEVKIVSPEPVGGDGGTPPSQAPKAP